MDFLKKICFGKRKIDPFFPSYESELSNFSMHNGHWVAFQDVPYLPMGHLRDVGSIPALGRSPGGWHGNPLQCSCLESPMDRGAWQATVHGVPECQTWVSNWALTHSHWGVFIKEIPWLYLKPAEPEPFESIPIHRTSGFKPALL